MKSYSFNAAIAILLTITLIAPSAFLIAPQRVYAAYPVQEVGSNLWQNTITAIKSTLTEVHSYTTAVATYAQYVNTYVLQPLAFVLSGNLLKAITAGILAFVTGATNGTGAPQFVQNLQVTAQRVGDIQALAYFNQYGRNMNSPFATSIASSLRANYLQGTSLSGFFAANQNTLSRYSPNVNAFLAGDWSQGGVAAWFALTTQTQNNPYTLYQASQAQLASLVGTGVGGAIGARITELNWGQGFLSWCGGNGTSGYDAAEATNGTTQSTGSATDVQSGANSAQPASSSIVSPGDPCTNSDGTQGTIKTPGAVILAALNKALGATQDKLVQMGQVANEVNGILNDIGSVMQTVNLATNILGSASLSTATGGLLGSGSNSRLSEFQTPGYLGVTTSDVYKNAATLPMSGSDMANRIPQYQTAWNTISVATNAASTSVSTLVTGCTDQSTIAAAKTALTTEIAPVLTRAATASANIAAATTMVQKVQSELNSGTDTAGSAYLTDIQTLQTMPPTMNDVADAQQDTQVFGMAVASPAGSLNVSGGTLVDQMNLLSTNAAALKATCSPSTLYDNSSSGDSR